MKQPELGKKIAELRQQRNLTQEELVEACNVSVRTIQRIESGEVTPRTSTVKILLSALNADFESFNEMITSNRTENDLKNIENTLQVAWISGIVYFVLGFLDAVLEYDRIENHYEVSNIMLYGSVKILYLVAYSGFIYGFNQLGNYFSNYLIKISSFILIGLFTIITFFDLFTIHYSLSDSNLLSLGSGESICFGAISVVFGVGLIRLQDGMGQLSKIAGILEIISGCMFAIVILFFLGYLILIPATILEIILLFKGLELIQSEQKTHQVSN